MLEYMLATGAHKPRFKLVYLKDTTAAASHRAACVFNNKIYALGGLGVNNTSINNFGVYDVVANTWTPLQPLPIASRSGALGANGNRLVYTGGYNQGPNSISSAIYTYSPATNQWTLASNQQSPARFEGTYETLSNGMQYLFGGTNGTTQNAAQSIDLTQTPVKFTGLNNMNTGVRAAGSLYDGDHYIYVAGGASSSVTLSTHFQRYDINTGLWTNLADLPVGCSYPHLVLMDGKIFMLTTNAGSQYANHIYAYDIATNTWSYVADVVGEVHALSKSVVHNGNLYLIGGYNGTSRSSKISKLVFE